MECDQLGPVPKQSQMHIAASLRQFDDSATLDHFFGTGHDDPMLIFKIFRADEWAQLQADGETRGAPIDLADGYIHFSGADTVEKTASLYFADIADLMLIAVEADGLDALKWEASRGGALFPHLFRTLRMEDVVWAKSLPIVDGVHQFPALT